MTDVPIDLLQHILPMVEPKGLFLVLDNKDQDATISLKKLDGLKKYLTETLEERIKITRLRYDQDRRQGATVIESEDFKRDVKWADEIRSLLKIKKVIGEAPSYISKPEKEEVKKSTEIKSEIKEEAKKV